MSDTTDTQPNLPQPGAAPRSARFSPLLLGILGFLAFIALGIMIGYFGGVGVRMNAQSTQVAQQLQDQFNLGNQALANAQYDVARAHFQFVIEHNPNYPGIKDAYATLLLQMQLTPTATVTPTPSETPTMDPNGPQALYSHIKDMIAAGPKTVDDWSAVLAELDSLRKADSTFNAVEVDGMYYMALRQRGIAEIFPASCKDTNLEAGIYDLTQATNFGPLDGYADALRTNVRFYITGATYWEIDWKQAQSNFYQAMNSLPNLMDSSCITSTDRWALATIKVADQLLSSGDVCGASAQYDEAIAKSNMANATAQPTASYADNKCHPPKPKATATTAGTHEATAKAPTATPNP